MKNDGEVLLITDYSRRAVGALIAARKGNANCADSMVELERSPDTGARRQLFSVLDISIYVNGFSENVMHVATRIQQLLH